jgi:hypothetical protein
MEQYISKRNYESTVVQETHISRIEQEKWPLNFVTSFPKVYLGFGIEDSQCPASISSRILLCVSTDIFLKNGDGAIFSRKKVDKGVKSCEK